MFSLLLLSLFTVCSSYQYDTTYRYPSSTLSSLYSSNPYKTASYGNDPNYPETTRYPSYSPSYGYSSYSTAKYPGYNTNYNNGYSTSGYNSLYGVGSNNVNYNSNSNDNLQRYRAGYGQGVTSNYNTGYGTSGYGTSAYGSSSNGNSGYGTSGYDTSGYGTSGYGSSGYGASGYGTPRYGSTGYGSGYGSTGYGTTGYGSGLGSGLGSSYGTVGYGNVAYGSNGYGSNNGYGTGYTSYEAPFMRDVGGCVNRSPQNAIWIDSLMGMWYGVELIQHMGADPMIQRSSYDRWESCIVIHISEPMDRPSTENQLFHVQHINARFRQQYRHLRLLWDEGGQNLEYSLYFRNDSAGYWHVFSGQNGTISNRRSYQQFSGTVQVLKAVNDHLLLNFCQEGGLPGRSPQLYSVLFSRAPGQLTRWEVEAIHSLLQTKKLSVASRRMVCGNNGADKAIVSVVFSILTCILALVVNS